MPRVINATIDNDSGGMPRPYDYLSSFITFRLLGKKVITPSASINAPASARWDVGARNGVGSKGHAKDGKLAQIPMAKLAMIPITKKTEATSLLRSIRTCTSQASKRKTLTSSKLARPAPQSRGA